MTLKETITVHLKESMLAKDAIRTLTLRGVLASITEAEKSAKDKSVDELSIVMSHAKKRKESIEVFTANARIDLADKETAELAVLQQYLPSRMTMEEIKEEVGKIVETCKEPNKALGEFMKRFKGRADATVVKAVVNELTK